jgi:hypothetical protein
MHLNELANKTESYKRSFWFCGFDNSANTVPQLGTMVLALMINSFIWESKIKKNRMSIASLMLFLDSNMAQCVALSRKMSISCQSINMNIFRRWCRRFQAPGIGEEAGQANEERRE